jgi:hypothetical protein
MRKSVDELTPKEWQARHDEACAIVARKYCDMFGFWHDCRYKPCRAARRCSGDQGYCLHSRGYNIPYDAVAAARRRMAGATPPDADRFLSAAHRYELSDLDKSKNPKTRAKLEAKDQARRHADSQPKTGTPTKAKARL